VSRIWQKNTIRQEVFLKAFGRGVCGREYIVIRQKNRSTDEGGSIRECVMTWIGYKEGVNDGYEADMTPWCWF
jgi:hypothetical protein